MILNQDTNIEGVAIKVLKLKMSDNGNENSAAKGNEKNQRATIK